MKKNTTLVGFEEIVLLILLPICIIYIMVLNLGEKLPQEDFKTNPEHVSHCQKCTEKTFGEVIPKNILWRLE